MKHYLTACAVLLLAACSPKTATPPETAKAAEAAASASTAPAGAYVLDASHTSVLFKVGHLGFSGYTAGFDKAEGKLAFDPTNPAGMTVEATIDPRSLDLPAPPPGFHGEMLGPMFFDAKKYPAISFRSTKVEVTGPKTAKVTGDLTLHGVTRPVTLDTTFNGGWAANAYDGARIGFSARGTLKRSAFGMGFGVPEPGTNMGVTDAVEVMIETEFGSGTKIGEAPAAQAG